MDLGPGCGGNGTTRIGPGASITGVGSITGVSLEQIIDIVGFPLHVHNSHDPL